MLDWNSIHLLQINYICFEEGKLIKQLPRSPNDEDKFIRENIQSAGLTESKLCEEPWL